MEGVSPEHFLDVCKSRVITGKGLTYGYWACQDKIYGLKTGPCVRTIPLDIPRQLPYISQTVLHNIV